MKVLGSSFRKNVSKQIGLNDLNVTEQQQLKGELRNFKKKQIKK